MSKPRKDGWIGARVTQAFRTRVLIYTEAREMNVADLVQDAIEEYMTAHPAITVSKGAKWPVN